jgi:hypothetical protein
MIVSAESSTVLKNKVRIESDSQQRVSVKVNQFKLQKKPRTSLQMLSAVT